MRRLITTIRAVSLLLTLSPALALDQTKPVVVTPVIATAETSSGQPIVLPQKDVQVLVSTYEIQPGATLPTHKHTHARYAYVVAGTLSVANEVTGATSVFRTGDFIVEAIDQWHRGANIGPDAVRLLVIDQIEKGGATVVVKD